MKTPRALAWSVCLLVSACAEVSSEIEKFSDGTQHEFTIASRDSLEWGTSLPNLYTEYNLFQPKENGQLDSWVGISYLKNGIAQVDTLFNSHPNGIDLRTPVFEGSDWFVNWADIPKIASFAPDSINFESTHFASILERTATGTYDYKVTTRELRIGDAKYGLGPEKRLHDHEGPGEHGFVSYATDGDTVHAFWLDGRATAASKDHDEHGHGDGAMQLRTRTITYEGHWGEDRLVDDRVCDCCPTDAALTSNGPIVVYRDRSENEIRDIYRALPGTNYPPAPIHVDGWKIGGCPVNGPAVAASFTGDTVAVTWYTEAENRKGIYLAWSLDGGLNFGAPVSVANGNVLGRVDLDFWRSGQAVITFLSEPSTTHNAGLEFASFSLKAGQLQQITLDSVVASRSAGIPRVKADSDIVHISYTEALSGDSTRVRLVQLW